MKKLISVILSAMLVLGMAGCSSETVTDPEIQQGTVILPETDSGDHSGNGEFPSSEQEAPTDTEGEKKPDGTTGDTSTTKPGSTGGNTQSGQTTQKPQTPSEETPSTEKPEDNTPSVSSSEYRAVWLSYLELGSMLTGKSENEFRNNIANAFSNITSLGMNTVIVHVRPFGDALYQSSVFPTSYLITGTEGDALSFDPLSVMIAEAHKQGLKLEAWVNPYRVRANT